MRGERDFEAYAEARSATVIRGLVLLGLDLAEAEETAATALASLRSQWREVSDAADPDVALWSAVLAVDARRRRRRSEPAPGDDRVAHVLRRTAGLEEQEVCAVLGLPLSRLRELLATEPPETDEPDGGTVLPLPYARVRGAVARARRRTVLVVSGVVAGSLMVTGLGYLLTRPEPLLGPGNALPSAATIVRENAADVVWWADGTLHLAGATVEVGEVQRLVAAGSGAAYVDRYGRLIAVTPDGRRTLLGLPSSRSSLVSSPRLGLVAWTDVSVPDEPRLVVWDVDAGERVGGVVTDARTRAISFDGGWLIFGTGLTDWAWDPHGGPAHETNNGYSFDPTERTALVDVVAGTRLEQNGYVLRVVRVGQEQPVVIAGFGGTLSPDGRLVLTHEAEGREPGLYDARTGEELASGLPEGWRARAATFVADGRISWLVDRGSAGHAIVTCSREQCDDAVEIQERGTPLIAQDSARLVVAGAG